MGRSIDRMRRIENREQKDTHLGQTVDGFKIDVSSLFLCSGGSVILSVCIYVIQVTYYLICYFPFSIIQSIAREYWVINTCLIMISESIVLSIWYSKKFNFNKLEWYTCFPQQQYNESGRVSHYYQCIEKESRKAKVESVTMRSKEIEKDVSVSGRFFPRFQLAVPSFCFSASLLKAVTACTRRRNV